MLSGQKVLDSTLLHSVSSLWGWHFKIRTSWTYSDWGSLQSQNSKERIESWKCFLTQSKIIEGVDTGFNTEIKIEFT